MDQCELQRYSGAFCIKFNLTCILIESLYHTQTTSIHHLSFLISQWIWKSIELNCCIFNQQCLDTSGCTWMSQWFIDDFARCRHSESNGRTSKNNRKLTRKTAVFGENLACKPKKKYIKIKKQKNHPPPAISPSMVTLKQHCWLLR